MSNDSELQYYIAWLVDNNKRTKATKPVYSTSHMQINSTLHKHLHDKLYQGRISRRLFPSIRSADFSTIEWHKKHKSTIIFFGVSIYILAWYFSNARIIHVFAGNSLLWYNNSNWLFTDNKFLNAM